MSSFLTFVPAVLVQLVLSVMAVFIILLVLVQRGRGGGLAGALGGPGGSSAFGAKAGDTFTRITIWAVSIWILMCLAASIWASNRGDAFGSSDAALIESSVEEAGDMESLDGGGEEPAGEAADGPALGGAAGDGEEPAEQ